MCAHAATRAEAQPEFPVLIAKAHRLVVSARQFPLPAANQRGIHQRIPVEKIVEVVVLQALGIVGGAEYSTIGIGERSIGPRLQSIDALADKGWLYQVVAVQR